MRFRFIVLLSICFAQIIHAQTIADRAEAETTLDNWIKKHLIQPYSIPIIDSIELTPPDQHNASTISLKSSAINISLHFEKSLFTISNHPDSLQKYIQKASGNAFYPSAAAGWENTLFLGHFNPKPTIRFLDKGPDSLAFIWEDRYKSVMTISQAPHCLQELEMTRTVTSPDCIIFKEDSISFRLELSTPMKSIATEAVQERHLELVHKKSFARFTRMFNRLSDGSILKTHSSNNIVRLDLIDSSDAIIWSRDSIHLITKTTCIDETNKVLYINYVEEHDKHIQKIDLLTGELLWEKQWPFLTDFPLGFNNIKLDTASNIYLGGAKNRIFSPEGELIWESEFTKSSHSNSLLRLDNGQLLSAGYYPRDKDRKHSFAYKVYSDDYQLIKEDAFFKASVGQVEDVWRCRNGDYILLGKVSLKKEPARLTMYSTAVVRINKKMELIWTKTLDNRLQYILEEFHKCSFEREDGSILILSHNQDAAQSGLYGFGSDDIYIACLEPDGQLRWQQTIGSPDADFIDFVDYADGRLFIGSNDNYWEYRLLD